MKEKADKDNIYEESIVYKTFKLVFIDIYGYDMLKYL
jgi:hypothetical protein